MKRLIALLLAALLSGCLADGSVDSDDDGLSDAREEELGLDPNDPDTDDDGTPDAQEPVAMASGEDQVRQAEVDDSGTSSRLEPTSLSYVATRTITIQNDFASANAADIQFAVSIGDVEFLPESADQYEITIEITMSDDSEQVAVDRADAVTVGHDDILRGDGSLWLETEVDYEDPHKNDPNGISLNRQQTIEVTYRLPSPPGLELALGTATADVTIRDFTMASLAIGSSTADITLDNVAADVTTIGVSTGDTSGDLRTGHLQYGASTGDLDLALTPTATGRFEFGSSTGHVTLSIPTGSQYGHDIQVATSTGDIDVEVEETEGSATDNAGSWKTAGYGARAIQTTIQIGTSTGDITVTG